VKKSMLEIYALAVCFVTVVCFVVSLGMALYAAVGIASPEFTMSSWTYAQYQTNDAFWNSRGNRSCSSEEKPKERPNDAELSKQREVAFASAVLSERRESTQTVVKTAIVMLIDLVVFLFHWHIAKRARASAA
jgi:hypothetical protein